MEIGIQASATCFQARSQNWEKRQLAVIVEQLCSHWTDFLDSLENLSKKCTVN